MTLGMLPLVTAAAGLPAPLLAALPWLALAGAIGLLG